MRTTGTVDLCAPPQGLHILHDIAGHLTQRYDAQPGSVYLLRPDQHIAARWRVFDIEHIAAALERALGKSGPPA